MRLGIDLGGTKIEIAALARDGQVLARRRVATPQGDYEGTVSAIVDLVRAVERELSQRGSVGIGIPGALAPASGLVRNANSVCLIGKPLRRDIEQALAREVRIENDANCFAIAEAQDGAGAGFETVFGVILGTGVGGGLVVNGAVLRGANAIAGEWGHNPLPRFLPADPADVTVVPDEVSAVACFCGHRDCIETWLSGPALARLAGRSDHDSAAVVAAAAAGDPRAVRAMADYIDRLARALASVINLFDPHMIVLGGGMSNADALYAEVPARWGRYVFADSVGTRLARNRLGDSAGVFGAARLWPS